MNSCESSLWVIFSNSVWLLGGCWLCLGGGVFGGVSNCRSFALV
jgi:hypothetical protein